MNNVCKILLRDAALGKANRNKGCSSNASASIVVASWSSADNVVSGRSSNFGGIGLPSGGNGMHSIIWRIARTPPYRLRVPSGAASALGNKLAGQKKFNTTPSAIVAAKIKGGRVITSGLSGRLSCIAFSLVRRHQLWQTARSSRTPSSSRSRARRSARMARSVDRPTSLEKPERLPSFVLIAEMCSSIGGLNWRRLA